jgi:hypothetical protein
VQRLRRDDFIAGDLYVTWLLSLEAAAAEQITTFLARLPVAGPLPWFICDAGDDPAS